MATLRGWSDPIFWLHLGQKLNKINRSKESLNAIRKVIEEEAHQLFNSIYSDVIKICKTAARFYHFDPEKKEQFVFYKVIAHIRTSSAVI